MKIVVIGGGPIGSKLVTKLREDGHEAVAASPDTSVDILTGEGLADALANATVVIDVSNPPSFEDAVVLEFFETSTRNLAQEKLIENSAIPYSIVRATQFFEFLPSVADAATDGSIVRFAPVLFQSITEDDALQAVARDDPPTVVTDPHAVFFGAELGERTLLPCADAVLDETRYRNWPGRTPTGDNAFLHELELYVRTALTLTETSQPWQEAVGVPIDEWLSDPADDQRYEASLRSLLGAVEALEDDSPYPETEGW